MTQRKGDNEGALDAATATQKGESFATQTQEKWEEIAKSAARQLVWAEANLMGKTLLPMERYWDLSDVRREARAEVDRLHSIGNASIDRLLAKQKQDSGLKEADVNAVNAPMTDGA